MEQTAEMMVRKGKQELRKRERNKNLKSKKGERDVSSGGETTEAREEATTAKRNHKEEGKGTEIRNWSRRRKKQQEEKGNKEGEHARKLKERKKIHWSVGKTA